MAKFLTPMMFLKMQHFSRINCKVLLWLMTVWRRNYSKNNSRMRTWGRGCRFSRLLQAETQASLALWMTPPTTFKASLAKQMVATLRRWILSPKSHSFRRNYLQSQFEEWLPLSTLRIITTLANCLWWGTRSQGVGRAANVAWQRPTKRIIGKRSQ